jgi:hypothetical protein
MATVLADYGPQEKAMQAYFRDGEARAMALGNRGPIRLTDDGKLHPDIVAAYKRTGFYVFEGVLDAGELSELEADFHEMVDRLPSSPDSKVDRHGRPALGTEQDTPITMWSKPLGDPLGGTKLANGRHVVKMFEPKPAPDVPDQVAFIIVAPNQYSEAALRLAGHPQLLAIAETIYGPDFVPFTDAVIIKKPGEGASFSWHQDGTTHWNSPDWDESTHGFNFMAQLYGSTAANGVWYLPGTHATGKVDLKTIIAEAGSDRLPNAVPLISQRGDVAISNRQVVHGSFANTSPDWRVTFNVGFHRRRSILGVTGYNGLGNKPEVYDAERIRKRSEMIGYAIAARRQHFPQERPHVYRPHAEAGESFGWDDAARVAVRGYSRNDLVI